jgi:YVTN family beta-propeller protein
MRDPLGPLMLDRESNLLSTEAHNIHPRRMLGILLSRNRAEYGVRSFSPSSYQLITRVPVGNLPHALAVTPAGRYVYVTNGLSNSISQISTLNNKVIRTIKLPSGKQHPLGITFLQQTYPPGHVTANGDILGR